MVPSQSSTLLNVRYALMFHFVRETRADNLSSRAPWAVALHLLANRIACLWSSPSRNSLRDNASRGDLLLTVTCHFL